MARHHRAVMRAWGGQAALMPSSCSADPGDHLLQPPALPSFLSAGQGRSPGIFC